MGDNPAGGALCFTGGPTTSTVLPKTEEQIDVRFGAADAPKSTMLNPELEENALVIDDPFFRNMHLEVPPMQATVTPASMHAVIVTSETGGLMAPKERRAALDFEVKNQKARRLQKTAEAQERRRIEMMRNRYPDGVLNVDSTANLDSVTYGAQAAAKTVKEQRRARHHEGRKQLQTTVSVAERRLGHNPFHHNETLLDARETKFLQSKSGRRDTHDTHDRLFGERVLAENPVRAQKLRNEDLGGKHYNIVTHSAVQSAPATVDERPTNKFSHMSQQSCERGRNTQGMILPSHR